MQRVGVGPRVALVGNRWAELFNPVGIIPPAAYFPFPTHFALIFELRCLSVIRKSFKNERKLSLLFTLFPLFQTDGVKHA